MNQQHPPSYDQFGAPQHQPQPPKKKRRGCLGITLGIVGAFVLLGIVVGVSGSGDTEDTSTDTAQTDKSADDGKGPAKAEAADKDEKPEKKQKPKEVVFKVWGDGTADITYGSDSDSRKGASLPMEKTLKFDTDAQYYHVVAQLGGSGDIHCSVTVDGETKKGHASGGYNICDAQLSNVGFGWQ